MVVVWDVSHAIRGGEVSIVAKAHTDVDIHRMRIAEFDDSRYLHNFKHYFFCLFYTNLSPLKIQG